MRCVLRFSVLSMSRSPVFFFFQAEDGIRDIGVTGVQTCALPISGGLVFQPTAGPVPLDDFTRWWAYVPGASWRAPLGEGVDLDAMADHPVVQVSYEDVQAYASRSEERRVGKECRSR